MLRTDPNTGTVDMPTKDKIDTGLGHAVLAFLAAAVLLATPVIAQQSSTDTAFKSMQQRGEMVMGVDQNTSSHGFQSLPDGGQIMLVRKVDDTAGVTRIRHHLRDVQRAFSAGDFSMPMMVHMKAMPGVSVMGARRTFIKYEESDLPNGATLRITTSDSAALAAIHEFLAFQRTEHHAGSMP